MRNSHDFRALLKMAMAKKNTLANWTVEEIEAAINDSLEHEFEHHTPGLGHPHFEIGYCVSFMEDLDTGEIRWRPSVKFGGLLPQYVWVDILTSVKDPSPTDLIMIEELNRHRWHAAQTKVVNE